MTVEDQVVKPACSPQRSRLKLVGRASFALAPRWLAYPLVLVALACSEDNSPEPRDASDAGSSIEEDAAEGAGNPAVLVAVAVDGVEGSRNVYVGALPEVPTGELDYSSFLEFGNVDVSTHGGYVFVWDRDPATILRLTVEDDLSLTRGPTISFANHGTAGGGHVVYISDTRAYIMSSQLDEVVVWNPATMEITGTIPVELPEELAKFPETFPHNGQVVGDSVIWQVNANDFDTPAIYRGVTLAIASATTDEPVRFVEDTRCVGTDGGYVDERGDYYVRAGAYWGYFAAFGEQASSVRTCVLRVRAGETSFDPDYLQDLEELTGTYVSFPWIHIADSKYLAQVWDPAQSLPADPNEYWFSDLIPLLVDVEAGTAEPYPDVDGTIMVTSAEYKVDGVSYYVLNEEGYEIGGSSDVVELRPEGIVTKFSVPGLWALARIR